MTPTQIISVLLSVGSVVGGIVAKRMEHPISDYLENTSEVEEEALPEVCGTLGEIVELAYTYAVEEESYVPSDLSNAEDASVVIHRSLVEASSESQISNLYDQLEEFAEPAQMYTRTRDAQSDSFVLFILTFAFAVIALLLDVGRTSTIGSPLIDVLTTVCTVVAVFAFGVALYRSYQWAKYRQELDGLVEEKEFIMDAERSNTSRRIELFIIVTGLVFALSIVTTFALVLFRL